MRTLFLFHREIPNRVRKDTTKTCDTHVTLNLIQGLNDAQRDSEFNSE
ncbi:hypothetical protein Ornrh_2132 [Ornithobacterium rhinotracheale DSM 15997]|uniref:Uncharacterized protein n=1 Tax=Ornithobacterium rhinotracheale (strain ATCC 51463 / DSM 15997 / CCUG 23171 / CIP 104009 / LMG 9086) TaxID=867902 RepID=I4A2T0_ORNRL|nr:hypothetical protein Ornrh_2132 [Ornithobacterium rhinotracheale DSM 15997]